MSMINNEIRRFAFIDAQNTATTTQKLLGFIVDWQKLCLYLERKWKCKKIFLYSGIDEGDVETAREFEFLSRRGYIVKTRTVFTYKKPDKTITVECIKCGQENTEIVNMGYNRKSNCDVDLTVDAMEQAGENTEFLIFTGDGDFDYLIRKIIEKGTKVHIVSSNSSVRRQGISIKRFSTRLKVLLKENGDKINLINIDSWRMKIIKSL